VHPCSATPPNIVDVAGLSLINPLHSSHYVQVYSTINTAAVVLRSQYSTAKRHLELMSIPDGVEQTIMHMRRPAGWLRQEDIQLEFVKNI
jgi:hypothetical protein